MPLTDRQQAFVSEYMQCWNASEAARRAGYAERSARTLAHDLMKKPEIQEAIRQRVADVAMSGDEALVRLAEQARASYAAYLTAEGTVNLAQMLADGKGHLIKGIRPTRHGLEVQFHDAQTALVTIARAQGVLGPKGTADDPLEHRVTVFDYGNVVAAIAGGSEGDSAPSGADEGH
jgi:phage terminase small subunit